MNNPDDLPEPVQLCSAVLIEGVVALRSRKEQSVAVVEPGIVASLLAKNVPYVGIEVDRDGPDPKQATSYGSGRCLVVPAAFVLLFFFL